MTATYARCTEPTRMAGYWGGKYGLREGCGWTGEVERVNEPCPACSGIGGIYEFTCTRCDGTGRVTHDGEGRWPWDIDKCPMCKGTIEIE